MCCVAGGGDPAQCPGSQAGGQVAGGAAEPDTQAGEVVVVVVDLEPEFIRGEGGGWCPLGRKPVVNSVIEAAGIKALI